MHRRKGKKKRKEINILLLGPSGVGKSTWINSTINYLQYSRLSEALKNKVLTAVPTSFTVHDANYEEILVTVKTKSQEDEENEVQRSGESATQKCRTYAVRYLDKYKVNLIDTPGIGDTRGIEQDKENIKNILDHVRFYENIHGICMLLKPNEARLTTLFNFCVKELLTHLHKSASENIVFCFTNSRQTFYKPGETLPTLKKLLDGLGVRVPLDKDHIFTVDNESYRYLCAHEIPNLVYSDSDRKSYRESWNRSVEETDRMLEYFIEIEPHKIQDTLTLNDTRLAVIEIAKPLSDVTHNIERNIFLLEEHQKELEKYKEKKKALRNKLYIPEIKLIPKSVESPRTVCTSETCATMIQHDSGISEIRYSQVCHKNCSIQGVIPENFPDAKLKECQAMDGFNCKICGCSWMKHMHILYDQYLEEFEGLEDEIEEKFEKVKNPTERKEILVRKIKDRVDSLNDEKETILQASAIFGNFLKENSITAYNDTIKEYLTVQIETVKSRVNRSENDNKIIAKLERNIKTYEEEVKTLEEAMKGKEKKYETKDIKKLIGKLQHLENVGSTLEKILALSKDAQAVSILTKTKNISSKTTVTDVKYSEV